MEIGRLSLAFAAAPLADEFAVAKAIADVLSYEPAVGPEDRNEAIRLREALTRGFAATAAGKPIAERDAATINSHAADDPPALRLTRDGTAARFAPDPVRAALAAIARDSIETIARDGRRLRICADADCGRVFLDRSRGKRRRWCSMERCGNRAKVAMFRRRGSR